MNKGSEYMMKYMSGVGVLVLFLLCSVSAVHAVYTFVPGGGNDASDATGNTYVVDEDFFTDNVLLTSNSLTGGFSVAKDVTVHWNYDASGTPLAGEVIVSVGGVLKIGATGRIKTLNRVVVDGAMTIANTGGIGLLKERFDSSGTDKDKVLVTGTIAIQNSGDSSTGMKCTDDCVVAVEAGGLITIANSGIISRGLHNFKASMKVYGTIKVYSAADNGESYTFGTGIFNQNSSVAVYGGGMCIVQPTAGVGIWSQQNSALTVAGGGQCLVQNSYGTGMYNTGSTITVAAGGVIETSNIIPDHTPDDSVFSINNFDGTMVIHGLLKIASKAPYGVANAFGGKLNIEAGGEVLVANLGGYGLRNGTVGGNAINVKTGSCLRVANTGGTGLANFGSQQGNGSVTVEAGGVITREGSGSSILNSGNVITKNGNPYLIDDVEITDGGNYANGFYVAPGVTVTWNNVTEVTGDVVVEDGGTLTEEQGMLFSENGKIVRTHTNDSFLPEITNSADDVTTITNVAAYASGFTVASGASVTWDVDNAMTSIAGPIVIAGTLSVGENRQLVIGDGGSLSISGGLVSGVVKKKIGDLLVPYVVEDVTVDADSNSNNNFEDYQNGFYVANGATVTWNVDNGGDTPVAGSIVVEDGGSLEVASGKVFAVDESGVLEVAGIISGDGAVKKYNSTALLPYVGADITIDASTAATYLDGFYVARGATMTWSVGGSGTPSQVAGPVVVEAGGELVITGGIESTCGIQVDGTLTVSNGSDTGLIVNGGVDWLTLSGTLAINNTGGTGVLVKSGSVIYLNDTAATMAVANTGDNSIGLLVQGEVSNGNVEPGSITVNGKIKIEKQGEDAPVFQHSWQVVFGSNGVLENVSPTSSLVGVGGSIKNGLHYFISSQSVTDADAARYNLAQGFYIASGATVTWEADDSQINGAVVVAAGGTLKCEGAHVLRLRENGSVHNQGTVTVNGIGRVQKNGLSYFCYNTTVTDALGASAGNPVFHLAGSGVDADVDLLSGFYVARGAEMTWQATSPHLSMAITGPVGVEAGGELSIETTTNDAIALRSDGDVIIDGTLNVKNSGTDSYGLVSKGLFLIRDGGLVEVNNTAGVGIASERWLHIAGSGILSADQANGLLNYGVIDIFGSCVALSAASIVNEAGTAIYVDDGGVLTLGEASAITSEGTIVVRGTGLITTVFGCNLIGVLKNNLPYVLQDTTINAENLADYINGFYVPWGVTVTWNVDNSEDPVVGPIVVEEAAIFHVNSEGMCLISTTGTVVNAGAITNEALIRRGNDLPYVFGELTIDSSSVSDYTNGFYVAKGATVSWEGDDSASVAGPIVVDDGGSLVVADGKTLSLSEGGSVASVDGGTISGTIEQEAAGGALPVVTQEGRTVTDVDGAMGGLMVAGGGSLTWDPDHATDAIPEKIILQSGSTLKLVFDLHHVPLEFPEGGDNGLASVMLNGNAHAIAFPGDTTLSCLDLRLTSSLVIDGRGHTISLDRVNFSKSGFGDVGLTLKNVTIRVTAATAPLFTGIDVTLEDVTFECDCDVVLFEDLNDRVLTIAGDVKFSTFGRRMTLFGVGHLGAANLVFEADSQLWVMSDTVLEMSAAQDSVVMFNVSTIKLIGCDFYSGPGGLKFDEGSIWFDGVVNLYNKGFSDSAANADPAKAIVFGSEIRSRGSSRALQFNRSPEARVYSFGLVKYK